MAFILKIIKLSTVYYYFTKKLKKNSLSKKFIGDIENCPNFNLI
jgi:hypothetical protein